MHGCAWRTFRGMKRSDFLKISSLWGGGMLGGLGMSLSSCSTENSGTSSEAKTSWSKVDGSMMDHAAPAIPKVRVAMLGLGNRGSSLIEMLEWLVTQGHAEIVALCDVQAEYVTRAADKVSTFQSSTPLLIDDASGEGWRQACDPEVADLVVIATPWHLHTPMALYAMEQGLHAASEVPIAYTEEDCLALVTTSERTQRHCIMLENCCYNGEELWLLNMVKEGVFGDVTHAECAYLHDLRALLLDATYYHKRWRLREHLERDGNLYTTHGLGPVCMYMDVLRGDNLSHLVSMSSNEAALSKALRASDDPDLQTLAPLVKCGDVNTTLIRTTEGKSIMLQFDTHTGRPYSRLDKLVWDRRHPLWLPFPSLPRPRPHMGLAQVARRRRLRCRTGQVRPSIVVQPQGGHHCESAGTWRHGLCHDVPPHSLLERRGVPRFERLRRGALELGGGVE